MTHYLKKTLFAIMFSAAVLCADENGKNISVFSHENADYWLPDAKAAFETYVGNWTGSESMTVEGSEIMRAEVVQSYVPSSATEIPRLVCSGKIIANGKSDKLELEIETIEKDVIAYVGEVKRNYVYWTPKYLIYVFDVQRDSFFISERGLIMSSNSKKYVEMPKGGFKGYIEVGMILERDNAYFPASSVSNSIKRDFTPSALERAD